MAIGACAMLVAKTHTMLAFFCCGIYSLSLITLFGISALYHRPMWNPKARARMRRLDHTAIFALTAGTTVPIAILGVGGNTGTKLLAVLGSGAAFGMLRSLFWTHAPKWITVTLYVAVAGLAFPFLPALSASLSTFGTVMLLSGGAAYAVGAGIYAVKKPDPWPRVFGYHEIFHVLVVVAAACHFLVIANIVA